MDHQHPATHTLKTSPQNTQNTLPLTPAGALFTPTNLHQSKRETILQLQRIIGNAAVRRLLTTSKAKTAPTLQRVAKSDLQKDSQVKFNANLVVLNSYWLNSHTYGVVEVVPDDDVNKINHRSKEEVKVKVITGAHRGAEFFVDAKYLDLSVLEDLPEQFMTTKDKGKQNLLKNQMEALTLVEQNRALLGNAADEVKQSVLTPEKIDQAQFNFCGPNDFLMAIALDDPVSYVNYIIGIYTAKKAYDDAQQSNQTAAPQTAKLGKMNVSIEEDVVNTQASNFAQTGLTQISQTDWMSMGSIRTQTTNQGQDYSNDLQVQQILNAFKGGIQNVFALNPTSDDLQKAIISLKKKLFKKGLNLQDMGLIPLANQDQQVEETRKVGEGAMPSEVASWFTQYGATDVVQDADPFLPSRTAGDIANANQALAQGKKVMLNINGSALQGNHSNLTQFDPGSSHWVLMQTPLVVNTGVTPNLWSAKVYSWGAVRDLKIDDDKIDNTFFGYVAAKINTPESQFKI